MDAAYEPTAHCSKDPRFQDFYTSKIHVPNETDYVIITPSEIPFSLNGKNTKSFFGEEYKDETLQKENEDNAINILSDTDKQLLTERYSELEFVGEIPNKLLCIQCTRLALTHYLSTCGHTFCKDCRGVLTMDEDRLWTCPVCEILDFDMRRQSLGLELQILSVISNCPNKPKGCEFSSALMEMPDHLKECEILYKSMKSLKTKTNSKLTSKMKREVETKMEDLENNFIRFQQATSVMLAKEFKLIGSKISEGLERIQDKMSAVNKGFLILNERLDNTIEDLQNPVSEDQKTIRNFEKQSHLTFFSENFAPNFRPLTCQIPPTTIVHTWVFNNIKRFPDPNQVINTESCRILMNGFLAMANVEFTFPEGRIQTRIRKAYDNELATWTEVLYPRISYIIHLWDDKKRDEEKRKQEVGAHVYPSYAKRIISHEKDRLSFAGQVVCVEDLEYAQQFDNTQTDWYRVTLGKDVVEKAVTNEMMTIYVCIDYPYIFEQPLRCDGKVMWRIVDFVKKVNRPLYMGDKFYSPYFLSNEGGYRMRAQINHGEFIYTPEPVQESLRRVPMKVRVLVGQYDNDLPADCRFRIAASIVDSTGNRVPVDSAKCTTSHVDLKLLTMQQMEAYVKDSVLIIEVQVEILET